MTSKSSKNQLFIAFVLLFQSLSYAQHGKPDAVQRHFVYTKLLNPREYPDDARRYVKPPTWQLFGNQTHFTTMRSFQMKDGKLVHYAEDFERYTRTFDLGDVIWPNCRFLAATNIPDMVQEMKRRSLFMYEVWGYVPGSGPGDWHQFTLSKETSDLFISDLGDKWLGMDMGEQDGRYLLGYSESMSLLAANRFEQYLNFHRHISRIANDMDNRLAALTAVTYGHYLVKDGFYTLVGAETAQMHPNGQVFYAFNRGAGKEYGVPWFGNASVFNRWGWKSYGSEGKTNGPTKGTSLSLMKRLLYSHILYNSMVVGFEGSWFDRDTLSPIGKIQQAAQQWVRKNPDIGVHQTPIGVLTDFYAGWFFPNYNDILYRVWGNLPYGSGDYLTNNVFGMLYPGYQVSSFYHDETGFLAATPYGDNADALLSDAPVWVMKRYPLLIVAGELSGGAEIKDKLQEYVNSGGHLMITAGSLRNLPGGLAGINVKVGLEKFDKGEKVQFPDTIVEEQQEFEFMPLRFPAESSILATVNGKEAVVSRKCGKGIITVFASPFGIGEKPQINGPVMQKEDTPLPNPYPLLRHVQVFLDKAFATQKLFDAGGNLSLITCRRKAGEYVLGIGNNTWNELPFKIESYFGKIKSINELKLDQSEKKYPEYLPEQLIGKNFGKSDSHHIAGGDFRIFIVDVEEEGVTELSDSLPEHREFTKLLPLSGINNLTDEVLARPTFFQHFDGVVVDWKYLNQREKKTLEKESSWPKMQKLEIWVDLSSGINLFPDLRLVNNVLEEYKNSMETIKDVMDKMKILGSENLLLSLHTEVENNISEADTRLDFEKSITEICTYAEKSNITVYLKGLEGNKLPRNWNDYVNFINKVNRPNLKLALNTAALIDKGVSPDAIEKVKEKIGVWLMAAPCYDLSNRLWNLNSTIQSYDKLQELERIVGVADRLPVISDVIFENKDDEYNESCAIDKLIGKY
jgi:hypothetical protein